MRIEYQPFELVKRFALTISRGTSSGTINVWVRVVADGVEGWGETAPFSWLGIPQDAKTTMEHIRNIQPRLEALHPLERVKVHELMEESNLPSGARAAIDMALLDWLGRSVGLPVWKLWGLDRETTPITSVTVGINEPSKVKERVQDWLEHAPGCALKIKLGSPQGLDFDRSIVRAVQELAPADLPLRVDANGGWNLEQAKEMCDWLAEQGVGYVEQPLARGQEEDLLPLRQSSPLPLFADESCLDRSDIVKLADRVDGINIKLIKCGGLTEAMGMIQTAQACGLQVMLGCFSESALSIQAAIQLSPLAQHLDLDSHLNMRNEPFEGVPLREGRMLPGELPGLGVKKGKDL